MAQVFNRRKHSGNYRQHSAVPKTVRATKPPEAKSLRAFEILCVRNVHMYVFGNTGSKDTFEVSPREDAGGEFVFLCQRTEET